MPDLIRHPPCTSISALAFLVLYITVPQMVRALILATLGWLILTGAKSPQQNGDAQRGTENTRPTISSSTPYWPYPDRYSDRCYGAQNHDSADLCAQWRAAISSEKSAHEARRATNWAIIATILSLIGVGGLIYTILQTHGALGEARRGNRINLAIERRARRESREAAKHSSEALKIAAVSAEAARAQTRITERALKEARKAADAAGQQVEVSRETARQRLRAYVGAQAINYTYNAETGVFAASAEIINYGQTPAEQFRVLGSLNYIPFPIQQVPDIGLPESDTHTLFPTMKTYINVALPASPSRMNELIAAQGCFFFTIVVEYFDYAGERHLERTRLYSTNNMHGNPWGSTHTATMTFYSGEGD